MDILGWVTASGIGIIVGFFPLHLWSIAEIIYSLTNEHKKLPKWMISIFRINPIPILDILGSFSSQKRRYIIANRLMGVIWIIGWLILGYYGEFVIYNGDASLNQRIIETYLGFTPLLLLTWLLPWYFLRRYLKTKINKTTEVWQFH